MKFTVLFSLIILVSCSKDKQQREKEIHDAVSAERARAVDAIVALVQSDEKKASHANEMVKKYGEMGDVKEWRAWSDSVMYYLGRVDYADEILDYYKPQMK